MVRTKIAMRDEKSAAAVASVAAAAVASVTQTCTTTSPHIAPS